MTDCDYLIVGAGIAGASMAAELAGRAPVLLVEAEDTPGYHATGRSAAFWHESYGGPMVQPLTRASLRMLADPDPDFAEHGFLTPRSALTIARDSELAALDRFAADFAPLGVPMERVEGAALAAIVPGLRAGWGAGVREQACSDIDVAGLHAAYLRRARRAGARVLVRAAVRGIGRAGGRWAVDTAQGTVTARGLVNAAGAWADDIARMASVAAVGIAPLRRTVVQLRLNEPVPADLPLTLHVGGEFYFKGESRGRVWLSPHDETPDTPRDVAAEEIDVAVAIDRLGGVVDWTIAAVERKWAGLRSFAPDRLPVYGRDPLVPDFIWCAGQGGFGIQTAPAAARLLAAELMGVAPATVDEGVDFARYAPGRLT